jgi:hypothetical protein
LEYVPTQGTTGAERLTERTLTLCCFARLGLADNDLLRRLVELLLTICYSIGLFLIRLTEEVNATVLFAAQTKTCFLGTSDSEDMGASVNAITDATVVVNAVVDLHGGAFLKSSRGFLITRSCTT